MLMNTETSRTLTISIDYPPARVQSFITDPRNLPSWAHGLGTAVRCEAGQWFVTTPEGEVSIRFAEANPFGVIDHWVRISPELEIHMPMRVLPNGAGSEVLITLFQATMSDDKFAADIQLVEHDLQMLKQVLEGQTVA
jgi:hypothetical protein